jgi:hypothetical protein
MPPPSAIRQRWQPYFFGGQEIKGSAVGMLSPAPKRRFRTKARQMNAGSNCPWRASQKNTGLPTTAFAKLWLEVEISTTNRYSTVSKADEVLKASQQKT